MTLAAPYPYFGGKSRIAAEVWARFGDTPNYVEPFCGSCAVLLARPDEHQWWDRIETVNDADGLLCNFWRALQGDPDAVAHHADWPVSECDLTAWHLWLVGQRERITERLMADPDWYDAKAAGWWLWGISCWIGGGWCSGDGPWAEEDGMLAKIGNAGRGVNRQCPHLGDAGRGVNRQCPHLGNAGTGICAAWSEHLRDTMRRLADRLRRVRVCCGDWTRVLGPTPTTKLGCTAVFLDPPYSHVERDDGLYAEDADIAAAVRDWAVARGDDPLLRIALCGYAGEHDMPAGWAALRWTTHGGYGSQGDGRGRVNRERETVWFSPHCLTPAPDLFGYAGVDVER